MKDDLDIAAAAFAALAALMAALAIRIAEEILAG